MADMKVIYDHREGRSSVPAMLDLAGVKIESAQLIVGDYIISDRIVIERKSAADLQASIISGRLFEQIKRMKEAYPVVILLQEGDPDKMHEESWKGALASALRRGVIILSTKDAVESSQWIIRLARLESKPPSKGRGAPKAKDRDRGCEQLTAQIPSISIATAEKLLKKFGSVRALANAEIEQLVQIDGIGQKRAKEIYDLFRHPYRQDPFSRAADKEE